MFRNGHCDSYDIYFLKAVPADKTCGNVACYSHHGYGIKISRSDTRYKIGCTGTRSCNTYSDFSRRSCITVGGVGSALLVSGKDVIYTAAVEVQLVENVDSLTAGITENSIAALFYQSFNNNFGS